MTRTISLVLFATIFAILPESHASVVRVDDPANNPGGLSSYEYVPENLAEGAPLVVALHACEQFARDFDGETGWVAMADRMGFALLFPEQRFTNNTFVCFNWFVPVDVAREGGESESIMAMVDAMLIRHRLDANRVFVTGLSAGAAMAQVMLARYPERFKGGALVAGVPFGCGTDLSTAFQCLEDPGVRPWGNLLPAYEGEWPSVTIWQGTEDPVVAPSNANALAVQWRAAHGLDENDVTSDSFSVATRSRWGDGQVELVFLDGMSHGTPIDLDRACGQPDVFTRDVGVCGAEEISQFFRLDAPPSEPPRILQPEEPPEPTPEPVPEGCGAGGALFGFFVRRRRRSGE
ncbi:MAG: PHB depolymerase family esterase [Myxococcota bacterium]